MVLVLDFFSWCTLETSNHVKKAIGYVDLVYGAG
jgi:hypothetical protein